MDDVNVLKRDLECERSARKDAEQRLDEKSVQLYQTNLELRQLTAELEACSAARAAELLKMNMQLQHEIGERSRLAQELAVARAEVVQATRLKSEFLATMSHEIRTPMNGIIGMAEMLLETALNPEQREYALVTYEESQKLLDVINSILDLSKIEAGKLILEQAEFSLSEVFQSVIRLLTSKAQAKGLTLVSYLAPDLPQHVIGDAVRIRQILLNLVENAVKFTDQGEVIVTVSQAAPSPNLTAEPAAHPVMPLQIVVCDTGIGMAEATLKSLFNPFTQADGSTTRRYGGTGLGLALTKRLIELMGGRIQVESQLGIGTQFTVTLPCLWAKPEPTVLPIGPKSATKQRCLVACSSAALGIELQKQLERWPFAVALHHQTEYDNTAILLRLREAALRGKAFSLVMVVHGDSAVEPITFASTVRADPLLTHLQLILLTDNQQHAFHQAVKEAGFNTIFQKPITEAAFVHHLSPMLEQNQWPSTNVTPASRPDASPAQPVHQPTVAGLILLVEDYANNQLVVLAHLKKMGYAAQVVENGQEAVDTMIKNGANYQLILMDWQMPVMDGLEATRLIRQHEAQTGRHIPIIGMTANAIKGDRERCLEAGMDDYLSKPIRRDDLKRVLAEWLPATTPTPNVA
ncbi:MAG: ATP-binding protein [Caldilineaceae bacterium]